jgi:hypothetical protein
MEEMLNQISNVGFPIVVSIYLLLRFEKKIDILTKSIDQLDDTMEKMMAYQK